MKMVTLIWILIGINTAALAVFIGAYFVINSGKNVDRMESSWTMFLVVLGLLIILLAAIPLRISQSTGSLIFSGVFAALPLVVALTVFVVKKWPAKKQKSFAKTYYKEPKQIAIAEAIENNDTILLQKLVVGADLNIQGIRVWDWPGLNYLQFAIRLRSNPTFFPYNEHANNSAIRILLKNHCAASPALAEGVRYLSAEMVGELIAAGADPNSAGMNGGDPLLFEAIGSSRQQNDIAIVLVKGGAQVNVKDGYERTPLMAAAMSAGTSLQWKDTWRFILYLLKNAKADYLYTAPDGANFPAIIRKIRTDAAEKQVTMPGEFNAVVAWLELQQVDTRPV